MTNPVLISNHAERAKDLLTSDFDAATNVRALLDVLLAEVQEVEQVFYDLIVEQYLSTAVGEQLDRIGAIVGEARAGLGDTAYRNFIGARIQTNITESTIPTLLDVISTITGSSDVLFSPTYPASFELYYVIGAFTDEGTRARILTQLEALTPAGVGFRATEAVTGYFGFDDDPDSLGFDEGIWSEEIT